jgi:UDP-glucose 4-epimerase
VTGSSGFLGGHLVEYLRREGYEVATYDIAEGGDVTDLERLRQAFEEWAPIDEVYHLAAQASVGPGEEDPEMDLMVNGVGTINVLSCVDEYSTPGSPISLVFTSSGAVYGLTDSIPHAEDALIRPTANYGCSKRYAELLCLKHALMHGTDVKVTRFSSVYGPSRGGHGPVNIFVGLALRGKPLTVYGDGSQTRDCVYYLDAIRGLRAVQGLGTPGEIFNIGSGREASVREIAEIVCGFTGAKMTYVGGHRFSKFDVRRSYFDISKARSLGYEPRVSLEEGIRLTIEAERAEKPLKLIA